MLKGTLKRTLSLFLAVVLTIGLLPVLTVEAAAEAVSGQLTDGNIGLSYTGDSSAVWTADGTALRGEVTGSNKTSCAAAKAGTTTLTITNQKAEPSTLFFSYTPALNGGSIEIGGESVTAAGSFTRELEPGASVDIVLTSAEGAKTTSLALTGLFLLVTGAAPEVRFLPPEHGSYTVDGTAVTEAGFVGTKPAVDGYQLSAGEAEADCRFFGWYQNDMLLSRDPEFTLYCDEPVSVSARFIPLSAPVLGVGDAIYFDWDDAIAAARDGQSASEQIVSVLEDSAMEGDYTIPSGVTLLVPFDQQNTCYTDEPESVLTASKRTAYSCLSIDGTLTVESGGVVSVSAKHCSQQGYVGTTGPTYGQIILENDSEIQLLDGSVLYAYGSITGGGTVVANPGSAVWEYFRIMSWRGGGATYALLDNPQRVFPFSQYYVQNIEATLRIYSGATERIYTSITAAGATPSASVDFIGEDALFELTQPGGYLEKSYDGTRDRLCLDIYGDLQLNAISMTKIISISSSDYVLPITNNMSVTVRQGTLTAGEEVSLLPGVEVTVDPGAALKIAESKALFAYDSADWIGKSYSYINADFKPDLSPVSREYTRTSGDLKDVTIDVNGTLLAEGGFYTTAGQPDDGTAAQQDTPLSVGGANIISSQGTGVIQIVNPADPDRALYEVVQVTNSVSAEDYHRIPITPATLKNEDGSYTQTAGAAAGSRFSFAGGAWVLQGTLNIPTAAQTYAYNRQPHGFALGTGISGIQPTITYRLSGTGEWSADVPVNAGVYDVKVVRAADAYYAEVHQELPGALVITPISLTVTWEGAGVPYNGQEQTVLPSLPEQAILEEDEVRLGTVTGNVQTNAGSYTARVEGLAGADSGNYILAEGSESYSWSIAQAPAPSITFPTVESPVTYHPEQTLAGLPLTGGSTEYGSFAWSEPSTVPTVARSAYAVTFTPSALTLQNYQGVEVLTQDVTVTVDKGQQPRPAVTLTPPASIGGTGLLTGLTTAMEWRTDSSALWSAVTASEAQDGMVLAPPFRGWLRYRETENLLPGEPLELSVDAFVPGQEPAPQAAVDYAASALTGLEPAAAYRINGTLCTADGSGTVPIPEAWYETAISIVKPGNGSTTVDSAAQTISLPGRCRAPEGLSARLTSSSGASDGAITGLSSDRRYEYRGAESGVWIPVDAGSTEIAGLTSGAYLVRCVASLAFASESVEITVAAPASGSGSPSYSITCEQAAHGTVTADAASARSGRTVTLTAEPEAGYALDFLTVVDRSGSELRLQDRGGGEYTFTMPASAVTVRAGFTERQDPASFSDVDGEDWYCDAVRYVVGKGLMTGTGPSRFSPGAALTRGMLVTILYRLEGRPAASGAAFDDVSADAWYADAVSWAAAEGIVTGYAGGIFGPDDDITREQLAVILHRYAAAGEYEFRRTGPALQTFRDWADVSAWAADGMDWAVSAALISGKSGALLDPGSSATRAETAKILMDFCETAVS